MALVRADLSVDQGRSIMLFTVVTICFLPLSFFAGIFGMNNQEMTGSGMAVRVQFTYMCEFPIYSRKCHFLLVNVIYEQNTNDTKQFHYRS